MSMSHNLVYILCGFKPLCLKDKINDVYTQLNLNKHICRELILLFLLPNLYIHKRIVK